MTHSARMYDTRVDANSIDIHHLHQMITDAIMTDIHMEHSQHQLHTDGVLSGAWGIAKSAVKNATRDANARNSHAQAPRWRKIYDAIDLEYVIIERAVCEKRPISLDELSAIIYIRSRMKSFVSRAFLGGRFDPYDQVRIGLPSEGGPHQYESVSKEVAAREKYRAKHPAVPGSQAARVVDGDIAIEKQDLTRALSQRDVRHTAVSPPQACADTDRAQKYANGLKIWDAMLLRDTLTEHYLAGNRVMSPSEMEKIQTHRTYMQELVWRLITDLDDKAGANRERY